MQNISSTMLPHAITLKSTLLSTPLGSMIAIASDEALYLLEFLDGRGVEREIQQLRIKTQSAIQTETNPIIKSLEKQLNLYFSGNLQEFKLPLQLLGSPFQQAVWMQLMFIPYGETRSYAQQASSIGKSTAYRAVANANGANQIAIIIPCHRIINANGHLGGYGGGIHRKQWLLEHEKKFKKGM